jgi:cobalamin biosynthesis Mg chelatase CobN
VKVRQIAPMVAFVLVLPAGAQAADSPASTAPPGSAAVDQYREAAPAAGSAGRKLTKEQRARLGDQGEDGRDLADALERNGGMPAAEAAEAAASATAAAGTTSSTTSASPATDGREDGGDEDGASSSSTTAAGAATTSSGDDVANASGEADRSGDDTLAASSASSTVGPFPVWGMVLAAFAVVGVAAVVRRRTT